MKEQLMSLITEDLYEGMICSDSSCTLAFIEDLVSLLSDDQLRKFAKQWDYDLEDTAVSDDQEQDIVKCAVPVLKKVRKEDYKKLNINAYDGEVILINDNAIDYKDKFYFNAQEFFNESYLASLEWYDE